MSGMGSQDFKPGGIANLKVKWLTLVTLLAVTLLLFLGDSPCQSAQVAVQEIIETDLINGVVEQFSRGADDFARRKRSHKMIWSTDKDDQTDESSGESSEEGEGSIEGDKEKRSGEYSKEDNKESSKEDGKEIDDQIKNVVKYDPDGNHNYKYAATYNTSTVEYEFLIELTNEYYCERFGAQHVLCALKESNYRKPIEQGISDEDIDFILRFVTRLRKRVLLGKEVKENGETLPRASKLRVMQWSPELQIFAQRIANHAESKLDKRIIMASDKFPKLMTLIAFSKNASEAKSKWTRALLQWYSAGVNQFPSDAKFTPGQDMDTYSALVWAKSYAIGCGFTSYRDNSDILDKFYVCVLGPAGNINGQEIYPIRDDDDDEIEMGAGLPGGSRVHPTAQAQFGRAVSSEEEQVKPAAQSATAESATHPVESTTRPEGPTTRPEGPTTRPEGPTTRPAARNEESGPEPGQLGEESGAEPDQLGERPGYAPAIEVDEYGEYIAPVRNNP